jgi:hypothetical protein
MTQAAGCRGRVGIACSILLGIHVLRAVGQPPLACPLTLAGDSELLGTSGFQTMFGLAAVVAKVLAQVTMHSV